MFATVAWKNMKWIRIGNAIYEVLGKGSTIKGNKRIRIQRRIVCTNYPWSGMENQNPFFIYYPPINKFINIKVLK